MAPVHPSCDAQAVEPTPPQSVRRRTVFYVSGFDPQGPGHYYRLFVEQAALQAQVTDYRLAIGPRTATQPVVSSWSVTFKGPDGMTVDNTYHFLRWDDIVRKHWPRGRWKLALVTLSTSLRILLNGSWWSMCRTSWVAGLTLALPASVGLLSFGVGAAVLAAFTAFILNPSVSVASASVFAAALIVLMGVGSLLPKLWRFGQGDWLMRSTASLLRYARGQAPDVESRISAWSEILRHSLTQEGTDETLVVAHSSGCIAAVQALARALQHPQTGGVASGPISFLTLGQCIPVLSHQPEADGFRKELAQLSQSVRVTWTDVTAPPDACCFALMDPCSSPYVSDDTCSQVKRLSPRYANQMSSQSYRSLKKDKFRCHFQYLMAFEAPSHYDYFRWVCGPTTLQQTTQEMKGIDNFKRFSW